MGKSKFYNGILWILKDKVYDSDLKEWLVLHLHSRKWFQEKR